jgi:carbon-monoxide dehydrogenase iron sulfur subunit
MRQIYCQTELCMACHLCEIHCLVAHSQSRNIIKAFKRESPRAVPRIQVEESDALSLSISCRQCREPFCVYACLSGALHKDAETGLIMVDQERCVGCWTCVIACPFGAIVPDFNRGKIFKCDLCDGQAEPACVANCPNEALIIREVPC